MTPRGNESNFSRGAFWLALAYGVVTGGLLAGLLLEFRDEMVRRALSDTVYE